jgi:mercuric ion binding protein
LGYRGTNHGPSRHANRRTLVLLKRTIATLLALTLPVLASAANRTVVLAIPTMDCETCPITIRMALMRVAGVSKAKVSYDRREARVTFDDSKTNVAALTEATKDVGYPSFLSDKQP